MGDISDAERVARVITEQVFDAYQQQATMPVPPLAEQTVLARLLEAISPEVHNGACGSAITDAANAALSALEERDPEVRGPRIASVDLSTHAVILR